MIRTGSEAPWLEAERIAAAADRWYPGCRICGKPLNTDHYVILADGEEIRCCQNCVRLGYVDDFD